MDWNIVTWNMQGALRRNKFDSVDPWQKLETLLGYVRGNFVLCLQEIGAPNCYGFDAPQNGALLTRHFCLASRPNERYSLYAYWREAKNLRCGMAIVCPANMFAVNIIQPPVQMRPILYVKRGNLCIANIHTSPGENTADQLRTAWQQIRRAGDVLLAGDFNLTPANATNAVIRPNDHSAYYDRNNHDSILFANRPTHASSPYTDAVWSEFDYFLANNAFLRFPRRDPVVWDNQGLSDHFPVCLSVTM